MKNQRTNKKINKKAKNFKFKTFEDVFGKDFKSESFQKAYNEEVLRLVLAKQIRTIRLTKHLTQEGLAKKARMPQSVIARIESGKHGLSLDTLNRIAQVFGKSVQLI
jgi:DNA-binding XRE family transcriptional regulator